MAKKEKMEVTYNNDLNALSFKNFGEYDLNFLMAICAKMRDLGEEVQYFNYETIMEIVRWDKKRTLEEFHADLRRLSEKMRHIGAAIDKDENTFTAFNLFYELEGNKQKRMLTVRINPRFKYILNDISGNFTTFELCEYVGLDGKYSKLFYQHLKQYRKTGWWNVELDDFRHRLGIPESMPTRNIVSKVINPSLAIIKTCKGFSDISYEVVRSEKRGRRIEGYKFIWTPKGQIKGQGVIPVDSIDPDKKKGKKVNFSDPKCKYECVGQETMDINEIDPDKPKAEPKRKHRKKGTTTREKIHNFEERKNDLNAIVEQRTLERLRKK